MTRKLAFSSVLTALTVVSIYSSTILPTGRIALLALASLCILATQAQCGTKFALIQYIASSAISLLLVPTKFQVLLFVAFIGYYPIVKCHIEQLNKFWLEWFVKIMFFNAVLIVSYFVITNLLLGIINFGAILNYILSHIFLVVVIAEVIFIIFDYILSLMASYYMNVVQKKLKNF